MESSDTLQGLFIDRYTSKYIYFYYFPSMQAPLHVIIKNGGPGSFGRIRFLIFFLNYERLTCSQKIYDHLFFSNTCCGQYLYPICTNY